jgi:hypothetical protein
MVQVTFPDGTSTRTPRPYTHAIIMGPADPVLFVTGVRKNAESLDADAQAIRDAAAGGFWALTESPLAADEYSTHIARLAGWDGQVLYCNADGMTSAFLYETDSLETGPLPFVVPVLDAFRNHAGGEVRLLESRARMTRSVADSVEAGDTAPLGTWQVVQWARSMDVAMGRLADWNYRREFGHDLRIVAVDDEA